MLKDVFGSAVAHQRLSQRGSFILRGSMEMSASGTQASAGG